VVKRRKADRTTSNRGDTLDVDGKTTGAGISGSGIGYGNGNSDSGSNLPNGTRPTSQGAGGQRSSQRPNAQSIGGDWDRVESRSQPGRFYYVNKRTGQKQWERPSDM